MKEKKDFMLHLHDAYYWDYIYKTYYMHCFAHEELATAMQAVQVLEHYNKLKSLHNYS